MKYTKFILSVLAVVLVASLGVVLTSCESSSPPPATTTGGDDITIPKVKLFENTSPDAPKLLREVSYERTVNAHKIYVKTTFVASNYMNDLRSVDSRIADPASPKYNIWGPLVIGIDRASLHLPATKNVIKLGLKVKTADPDFEFDNVIRIESPDDGNQPTKDMVPVKVAFNSVFLDTCAEGADTDNNYWWDARDSAKEKKYQGGSGDTNSVFISGAATELNNEYGEINKVDANFTYDPNTGEYVFTIPFTVIPYNDIDKIVVFGAQNAEWRGDATISAVVKPLGSSKTLVYADVNGVAAGIPVVKVPKSKNESPSLIQGSFPDVISSINTSIDAKSGAATSNISVELVSISSNASNMIVFTGPQGSSTASVTNWLFYGGTNNQGDYLYTNTIALKFSATSAGSPDFYAHTNYTVSVVAGNGGNATISVTVEPTISVDRSAILLTSDTDQYTINVSVADGYSTPTSAIASNVNSGATYTVTLTSGSGSFTLGGPSSTADLKGSSGDSIVVFYDDTTSGKRITSSSIKIVSGWSVAGYGEYSIWAAKIDMVAYKINSSSLEILVTFNPIGSDDNKLYLAIDVTNRVLGIDKSTNTHDPSGDLTTGGGSFWMTNEAGIDYDFIVWGPRSGQYFNYSSADAGAHRIESSGSGTDVKSSVTVLNTNLVTTNDYYFNIPFSAMGANSGDVVNIYVFFGKAGEGGAGKGGIRSIFPANASVTAPGTWGDYVTRLTNKSPNIVLP